MKEIEKNCFGNSKKEIKFSNYQNLHSTINVQAQNTITKIVRNFLKNFKNQTRPLDKTLTNTFTQYQKKSRQKNSHLYFFIQFFQKLSC